MSQVVIDRPDLGAELRALQEVERCVGDQHPGPGGSLDLGGAILGEMDWRTELHDLLFGRFDMAKNRATLLADAKSRKEHPVATGFLDYFPDAVLAVANLSFVGNQQHNPGTPLHWDRAKSADESDALMRHFLQRGTVDSDGVRHSTKAAWRALALLQKELEAASEGATCSD